MSFAPATLLQARAYVKSKTGLPDAALGIVGDRAHAYGYHLGKDRLPTSDYSRSLTRDRNGLTNAASAFDIGHFPRLRQLTAHLVREARAGRARDVREIIGPGSDGRAYRWDVTDGWTARIRSRGDSHEWHTHLSYFRDSENRSKLALFQRFFDGTTATTEGDDMIGLKLGDEGLAVRTLQAMLSAAGFAVQGGADGKYGPNTAKALLACRKSEGSGATNGNTVDHWAYQQVHRAVARRRAEAAASAVGKEMKAALEAALAKLPSMPSSITIDLPDTITVPVEPADES